MPQDAESRSNYHWQQASHLGQIFLDWYSELIRKPNNLIQLQGSVLKDYVALMDNLQQKMFNNESAVLFTPDASDKRFNAMDWHDQLLFYYIHQLYLLMSHHSMQFIQNHGSQNPKIAKQISFYTHQALAAWSPTNFWQTNPEILQQTLASKGENLKLGFKNFLEDFKAGKGQWHIKITDTDAFTIGENIAITKGKIIFQNRLMQLIHYYPTTKQVYERPLLIVPPWINKYYILDLTEKNSFVKWAIDRGYTLFMISWVNPDASYQDTDFEDYMKEGIFPALEAISQIMGVDKVNALGFCVGGTLLAATLGFMQAKNDDRIHSATLLNTLIDFYDPGDIEVFIDEPQVTALEEKMNAQGYLDGRTLMMTFSMLRSNNLFWSYYVNNYLSGKNPYPFDLLYWNCDPTNLPAKMHSYYLRNMYLQNRLCHPNSLTFAGVKLNLHQVNSPIYFLSTEQDHIAPWQTVYSGAKLFKGEVTFVLAGSGHIAGVINPPANHKYSFRYGESDCKQYSDPLDWLKNSTQHPGSWWEHWSNWLKKNSGEYVLPKIPGSGPLKAIEDAPGEYVKKRLE